MTEVTLFGALYSVYVRIARLVLEEKGVPYSLQDVDIFAEGGPPPEYLARHPFGRIPAFEHDDFQLFEAAAIARYVDEAFDGPPLMPATAQGRARANQIIGLLDSYAYRALVWNIYVEEVSVPNEGGTPDPTKIAAGRTTGATCLHALTDLMAGAPYLVGEAVTLADLHAAPMIDYLRTAPTGRALLADYPAIGEWWARMKDRPSVVGTAFPT